jgi:hypothetical protein
MFDFRKPVRRHHSIDVPFHDGFSADRDRYLLRDNNDILVTRAGVRIAGLNHSSSSRVQRSLVSAFGVTAAQRIYVEHPPLNEGFPKPGDAGGIRRR